MERDILNMDILEHCISSSELVRIYNYEREGDTCLIVHDISTRQYSGFRNMWVNICEILHSCVDIAW